jgi:hypothetical protein
VGEEELEDLIAGWAARHAPELIARAQADALEAARVRLQERLVDALLHAADARLTAPARREPRDRPASDTKPGEPLLWVYGVAAAGSDEPPAVEGVEARPVRLHRHAGLTALVSDVPPEGFSEEALRARLEDLEGLEALARAHEAVLEAAMTGGAVVPFRLCTIYSSADRLNAMLVREGLTLTAALDRLDGMQEWGVKAFLRAPATASAAGAPTEATSGTEYLTRKRERRDAADTGREAGEDVVARIHDRLVECASAASLSRPQDRRLSGREDDMVLNAAYLLPAERAGAFHLLVETLGRRHEPDGVDLELTGPWPPYHFVETPES